MRDDELYERLNKEYDITITDTLKEIGQIKPLTRAKLIQALLKANKAYWIARLSIVDEYSVLTAKQVGAVLSAPYYQAANEYVKQFRSIYANYQSAFDLSKAEADRLLKNVKYDRTIMQNLRSIADAMPDSEQKTQILATISAPAYRYRLERAQVMMNELQETCKNIATTETVTERAILQTEVEKAYNITLDGIGKQPAETILEEIAKQANETAPTPELAKVLQDFTQTTDKGITDSFHAINERAVKQIVNRNWSGESFSSRIWAHTDELSKTVKDVLLKGELSGASVNDMAAEIRNRFDVAAYQARRLVRTELNYVQNQATLQEFKDMNVERYEYAAFLDDRTSEICEELNGHIFFVKDAKVGVNYPPMHPNCRSGVYPVMRTQEDLRNELDNIIDSFNIPNGMSLEEFIQKDVEAILERRNAA